VYGGPGPFWASATHPFSAKARGMAIFFSNKIPVEAAHLVYPLPHHTAVCGRIIVVTARLYGRPTHIIGFHADCTNGHELQDSIERLAIVMRTLPASHDIVLLSDHNHCISPALDYFSSKGAATGTTNHEASRRAFATLLAQHTLYDTYRHLHPNKREYTRKNIAYGEVLSKSCIDGIFVTQSLLDDHAPTQRSNCRRLIEAKHIHGSQKDLYAIRINVNNTHGTAPPPIQAQAARPSTKRAALR